MAFERCGETRLWTAFFILCLLYTLTLGSVATLQEESSRVGDVLLEVFGRPFAVVFPQDEVSSLCQEHSKLYLLALANMTPWAINSKLIILYMSRVSF